jgi:signal transduction histidine kinase
MVETIFVPFFTTKRGGSGIGLSLAQHVARAHGGAITVGDRPGGGAVFAIVLP